MHEYLILLAETIKEISEEISERAAVNNSSSFLVNSKHGKANIQEVDRKDFAGREHIGISSVISECYVPNDELIITEIISAILRWIDYGSIPSEILFNIDSTDETITVNSYLFGGKSKDDRLFCVKKEYDGK